MVCLPGHLSAFAHARLSNGDVLPVGCMVWSAGLAPVKLVNTFDQLEKHPSGRLKIDGRLQLVVCLDFKNPSFCEAPFTLWFCVGQGHECSVWALGDCAIDEQKGLPPIAPAAMQQGSYLAKCFNKVHPICLSTGAMLLLTTIVNSLCIIVGRES